MTKIDYDHLHKADSSFLAVWEEEKGGYEIAITLWAQNLINKVGGRLGSEIIRNKQKLLIKEELKIIIKNNFDQTIVICSDDLIKLSKNLFHRGISTTNKYLIGVNTVNSICKEAGWHQRSVPVISRNCRYHLFSNVPLPDKEMKNIWTNNKNIINKKEYPIGFNYMEHIRETNF